ncbi:ABC-1 domain-containing protein [Thalassoporum mexicanum PCC 7367]|uniref:ABC1 kinase family protein n=1 Tax=Thalassoporum mexicanum TaxID=3457544 RepID=UPI00029F82F5|nr:AarF/ABC1/UbiB kinase family protein [Pseudanabaena sp. PCC 7367]AFY70702.1 ABC-1 domain-containing protein [Pseudanabaena sp. PCC 7367]
MLSRTNIPFGFGRQAEIVEVVVRNGWDYFRSRLAFINGQLNSKPTEPSLPLPDVLKQILIELGPTFVKLGQILSTRPDLLAPEYIEALETLQSDVPGLSWSEIAPILEAELSKPIVDSYAEVEEKAIAAGSLGQVHKGKLLDGQVVAIKVQRPGIQRIIEEDLEVLRSLAQFFSGDALGEAYDLEALVEEFSNSITGELDFTREARNTEELTNNLANSELWKPGQVIIPKVYWQLTSTKVLTLEWIDGVKINQTELPAPKRKELAALAAKVVMQQILLDGFFHADPHPGNFFYVGDDKQIRLAMIDCGMVSRMDPRTKSILTDLLIGIVYEQPRQVAQAVRELGFAKLAIDIKAIESAFDRLLRRFYTRPLEEIDLSELLNEALRIPRENKIQMPGSIGLFVKAIANVEGIARNLDPLFPFIDVARPVVEKAIQQRILNSASLQSVTYNSLYLSRALIQIPQQIETLADRLERSELGLNLNWQDQESFQRSLSRSFRRLGLAMLAVGGMLSGSMLLAAGDRVNSTLSPNLSLIWSEAVLVAGLALGIWLLVEYIVKS